MSDARGHAVVIGASMGGVLAARALAGNYERVTVVERDSLPPVGAHRKGVPQGRHAHGLLARGREALEELFPGLTQELVELGGLEGDVQGNCRWINDGHRLSQAPSGLNGLLVSRPLLEGHLRDRLRRLPGVELQERCTVRSLLTTPDRSRVTGIAVTGPDGDQDLQADLVVDASGRASRGPAWLEELGYEAPGQDTVEVAIGYATRTYRRDPDHLAGDTAVIHAAMPPERRIGVMLAVEGDRWVVTLGGYAEDRPPTDPEAWLAFAESLQFPDIAEVVRHAEPLDEPIAFRYPASTRRRYEKLRRFPQGYLAFGDSLCSFNPIYGQGMTVASLEALALRDCLGGDDRTLARQFFTKAARLIDVPWDIAVGSDLRFDHVNGKRTAKVRFVNRYIARLHAAAETDPALGLVFLRVVNLMDRPESLLRPSVMRRVLRGGRRRAPAAVPPLAAPVSVKA